MHDLVLDVSDLSISLNGRSILRDITMQVRAGECVGLLGPNGSGKSTTLHAVTGILAGGADQVHLLDHRRDHPSAKADLGFVPDDLPFPASLSGAEFLGLHARLRGRRFDLDRARQLSEVLGIDGDLDRPSGDYSHGMIRKLHLIAGLAHHPRLLILDEPMRGLDPVAAVLMRDIVTGWPSARRGLLMATHELDRAATMCDRVYILSDGQIVAGGRPEDIRTRCEAPTLEAAFMALTGLATDLGSRRSRLGSLLRPAPADPDDEPALALAATTDP